MNNNKQIRVAITQGDTNGIGYELIFKAFSQQEMFDICTPVIYGSAKVADIHRQALNADIKYTVISNANQVKDGRINLLNITHEDTEVAFGAPSSEAGRATLAAIDRAIADINNHLVDVLVTGPANVESLELAEVHCKNQLNYVAESMANQSKTMTILANNFIRVASASDNESAENNTAGISGEALTAKIELLALTLKRDFRLSNPRIAILTSSSTPSAEEIETTKSVIEQLADKKTNAFGPYTADTLTTNSMYEHFDAILAMNSDQGKSCFLTVSPEDGVETLVGLPLVCVQPVQDASYAIAGKNVARENQLYQAIYLAIDTLRNRSTYDEPMANPLPKLYHEKRDESEKVRFAIPKKHEHSIPAKDNQAN